MKISKITPDLSPCIWGGDKLVKQWNKVGDSAVAYGESWELSFHKSGMAYIDGQPMESIPSQYLGSSVNKFSQFPVLTKIITALDNLSVQVHPDDAYAKKMSNELGKTELWYILSADEGSGIYLGLSSTITKQQFGMAISNNTVQDYLHFQPVNAGQCYLIPAGTIHAIGKGVTLYEVQQNSNLTYRIYDYGRVDVNGKPRQLHVSNAQDVSLLCQYDYNNMSITSGSVTKLGATDYFTVYHYNVKDNIILICESSSFHCVTFVEGGGLIGDTAFVKGDTFFVPAGFGMYHIVGKCQFILTYID